MIKPLLSAPLLPDAARVLMADTRLHPVCGASFLYHLCATQNTAPYTYSAVLPCFLAVKQVWYSAVWSSTTLKAFRKAVGHLLKAAVKHQPHPSAEAMSDPLVLELLRHWHVKEVKLAAARKGWQVLADTFPAKIANFTRPQDRTALCHLALTGEVPELGAADGGSVVMFAIPKKFGERAFDECFLQVRPMSVSSSQLFWYRGDEPCQLATCPALEKPNQGARGNASLTEHAMRLHCSRCPMPTKSKGGHLAVMARVWSWYLLLNSHAALLTMPAFVMLPLLGMTEACFCACGYEALQGKCAN